MWLAVRRCLAPVVVLLLASLVELLALQVAVVEVVVIEVSLVHLHHRAARPVHKA